MTTTSSPFEPARLIADEEFRALAVGADVSFRFAVRGGESTTIALRGGALIPDEHPDFVVELDRRAWAELLSSGPPPGKQHVLAHIAPRGTGVVIGDQLAFAQNLHLVRRAIEVLGDRTSTDVLAHHPPDLRAVTGRYVRVTVDHWGTCDVYVESVGQGRPVVLLHTAGSDSTQYHGLFGLAHTLPGRCLIAFDLPWHGRSGPAHGKGPLDYELTSEGYAQCVAAVIAALELPEPPVLVGASMAGAAVIEVAARHPHAISGAIGCQVGPRVSRRHNQWLRSPRVNQALFVPEWTFGLMAPQSPKPDRDRVWWGYSRGGFAIYERDITYYTTCWDIDNVLHMFGERTPPVVLMSGAYDYTVPPNATEQLAALIPGARYRLMPELGHFPHAEHPAAFVTHLAWALQAVDTQLVHRRETRSGNG
jgi:pimeloyl-ACP methyl ester carboxylesterase